MTKKKKIIWRLSQTPTVELVTKLMDSDLLSKDEAKEILFRNEEDIPKDELKDIKDEIKLLRKLVLARDDQPQRVIIQKYYDDYWTNVPSLPNWTYTYCSSASINDSDGFTITGGTRGTTTFN